MTRQLDDQLLESWLAEGPSELPERVVARILRNLDEKRAPWWLPGRGRMNRMLLTVGGIAAAIVIVVVSVAYFDRGRAPSIGEAGPTSPPTLNSTPSPTPAATTASTYTATASPIATGSPIATASPLLTSSPTPTALPSSGLIEPGRYFVEVQGYSLGSPQGYRYIFTVPERGWESEVLLDETFLRKDDAQGSDEFGLLLLAGWAPSTIYAHPCDPGQTVDSGRTVEDFASALGELEFYDVLKATDVSLSGYQGKQVRMFASGFTTCYPLYPDHVGTQLTWDGRDHNPYKGPSVHDSLNYDVRILDLDGTRHLFYTAHVPGPDEETSTVLSQIVDSMEIERATR